MTYEGPERRRLISQPPIIPFQQFVVVLTVVAAFVAVLFLLAVNEANRTESRLAKIESQQRIANDTAENAKVVADFIRDCIFYAEEGRCPVKNLQIIKEDNPTGNPKPTTTTTVTSRG